MNVRKLSLGRRYQLPHGTGVLTGYEGVDPLRTDGSRKYFDTLPNFPNAYTRFTFKLDEGHTWATNSEIYCAWGVDIKRIPK